MSLSTILKPGDPFTGRRAKQQRGRGKRALVVVAGLALTAGATIATMAGFTSTQPAGTPWIGSQAQTVISDELASYSPVQRVCQDFAVWERHQSAASLNALVVDSTHLAKSYLKADVAQLYADVSSPSSKAAKYAAKDPTYITQDCQG